VGSNRRPDNGTSPSRADFGFTPSFTPLGQTEKKPSFAGSGSGTGQGRRGQGAGGGGMEQAAAAAASSGSVKQGAAGSFDPSMFAGGAGGGAGREGFFVARDCDQRQADIIDKVVHDYY
jgi:hypothetical protein